MLQNIKYSYNKATVKAQEFAYSFWSDENYNEAVVFVMQQSLVIYVKWEV